MLRYQNSLFRWMGLWLFMIVFCCSIYFTLSMLDQMNDINQRLPTLVYTTLYAVSLLYILLCVVILFIVLFIIHDLYYYHTLPKKHIVYSVICTITFFFILGEISTIYNIISRNTLISYYDIVSRRMMVFHGVILFVTLNVIPYIIN